MANVNTIKTRILNKYDELANYSNFTPLKGEVCIAVIGETTTENQGFKGDLKKKPIVGIKVGDGVNKFMDLPWIQAVAGDVSSFVKDIVNETKFNELVNALIANAQLATKAELKEVSDALAALTTRVTTAEGKITDIETAINTGDNSLANLRQAINNVLGTSADDENANTVYGAKAYAKKQAEAALADAKADAEKYELKNVAAGLVNGLKENEIKTNADAITAINTKIGEANIGENATITSAIAALQETVGSSGEQSLGSRVEKLEETIGDSTDGLVKDVADLQAAVADNGDFGKRVVALEGEMDVVQAATAGYDASKTIASDIQAAKDAAGAAQSQADENKGTLEVLVGTNANDANKSIRDIAALVISEALVGGGDDFDTLQEIAAWLKDHPEDVGEINAAIQSVKANLGYGVAEDGSEIVPTTVDSRIAAAIAALEINTYAKADALAAVSSRVEAIEKAPYATEAYADGKASAAQAAAEATAAADATQKANAAQAAAEATASADATQKANAAQAAAEAKVTALADGQVKTNTDAIDALDTKVNALVESDGNTGMVSGVTQNAETGKITVSHRAITHADLDTNDVFVFYCGNATGYATDMASVEI